MSPHSQRGVKKKKKKHLSTSNQHSVQSTVQQAACVMDCHSSGNKLLTPSPDPFPVWRCVQSRGEMESVCSMLLRRVFPNPPPPPLPSPPRCFSFSLSQVMFQVGWQSTACSHRQSRKFVSSIQKHVLTVCTTSGGLFTQQSHSSWQLHDTICMTGSVLTPWNSKTVVTNEKRGRSTKAIVCRRLLREVLALVKE